MSSQHASSHHPLKDTVHEFILSPDTLDFEDLALQLFAHQFDFCLPYQRFATSLGQIPSAITTWQEIPALPTSAFKLPEFPLSSGRHTFLTSGTTTEVKGAHHFPETDTYDLAALTHWKAQPFAQTTRLFFLSPSDQEAPQSSLSHMFGHLQRSLDPSNASPFLIKGSSFDLAPLLLETAPLILAGTALAFLHLMETHQPIPLPPGSHLLETGGYKGTSRTLAKPDFYHQLSQFFGLPTDHLHNEYGMTELSSQAYATSPEGTHRFPHWCRHRIICPETEQELLTGETGYLVIHDLANLHSVAAIRTQDFATAHPDSSFTLHGRDPGALPRGCSRSIDDALTR